MGIFSKIKEKGLVARKNNDRDVVISVPDIKEYLVKEYERVNDLKLINEGLQQQLERAEETQVKYETALVTLDEYAKRLELSEKEIDKHKTNTDVARRDLRLARDEINSYKIKFNTLAITKEEIAAEIIEEVKEEIILLINSHKGNLSKKTVCEIIRNFERK